MGAHRYYTDHWFGWQRERSRQSAHEIVPLVMELLQPASIVDVGCGVGTWLSVFKQHGVADVLGIDGHYVDKAMLEIPEGSFLARDLTQPLRLERRFDLVVSLEVAEHLPPECAEGFVDNLIALGPAVLFSAAIPLQGGTGHLNERWPDYWAGLFERRGYLTVDCLRRKVWKNRNVASWYAQNTIVYATPEYLDGRPLLREELARTDRQQLALVHPKRYLYMTDPRHMPLGRVLAALPVLVRNAVLRRLGRVTGRR
jgi:SAM-dependent methyltransferase